MLAVLVPTILLLPVVVAPVLFIVLGVPWLLRDNAGERLWKVRDAQWDHAGVDAAGWEQLDRDRAALDSVLNAYSKGLDDDTGSSYAWSLTAIVLHRRMMARYGATLEPAPPVSRHIDEAIARAVLSSSVGGLCWAAALAMRAAWRGRTLSPTALRVTVLADAVAVTSAHRARAEQIRLATMGVRLSPPNWF